jgi:putative membrane protein
MVRTKLLVVLAVLALGCILVPLAVADDKNSQDAKFVVAASGANYAEINFGKLAQKQASNAEVRKFALQMVDDHTKAAKELNDLAFQKKWNLAANMDREHQAEYDRLSKLEGADFDREYMRWQIKDHENVINMFADQAKNGDDAQLKDWCNRMLPHLREHLKLARTVNDAIKSTK